jgi:mannose-6-phosphate isomerase-like protein (cupin superfamily)
MMKPQLTAIFIIVCSLAGCAGQRPARGRIITPLGVSAETTWKNEDKAKPIAGRLLRSTNEISVSLIRLRGAEAPHIHANHDLTVVMLSGSGVLHLGDKRIVVGPGDVMEIPRGVVHWAENTAPEASEVYAIFSPPYLDNKDNVPVEAGGGKTR